MCCGVGVCVGVGVGVECRGVECSGGGLGRTGDECFSATGHRVTQAGSGSRLAPGVEV